MSTCFYTHTHTHSLSPPLFCGVVQEVERAVSLLEAEAQRLGKSSGYGSKILPLPLYAGIYPSIPIRYPAVQSVVFMYVVCFEVLAKRSACSMAAWRDMGSSIHHANLKVFVCERE